MSLHKRRVHPGPDVENCFACKISGLQFAVDPAPGVSEKRQRDLAFQRDFASEFENGDREAYRRLRANGVQPPTIRGSAHLEAHADSKFEIETGGAFAREDKTKMAAALTMLEQSGIDPLKAAQPKAS